jgi:hypothetical protein
MGGRRFAGQITSRGAAQIGTWERGIALRSTWPGPHRPHGYRICRLVTHEAVPFDDTRPLSQILAYSPKPLSSMERAKGTFDLMVFSPLANFVLRASSATKQQPNAEMCTCVLHEHPPRTNWRVSESANPHSAPHKCQIWFRAGSLSL